MFDLMDRFESERVSISLSSMHASTITPELAQQVRRVRKSGFTIAPEAGTQRLRNVINKNLSEEQILEACRLAFEAGWDLIKLYFMLGLPTETDADVDGMVDLAHEILAIGRRGKGRRRRAQVTLSASSFIPKPETPFQWMGMDRLDSLQRKQNRIADRVRRGVRFKHHHGETSFLEGVFSRGDRALCDVLEQAWRGGARFDGWAEHFNPRVWQDAFRDAGIDPEPYAFRELDPAHRLPWQVIDSRVNRKWLALELKRALGEGTLSVCGPTDCHGCAPFAKECVKGIVAETTGRWLDTSRPLLSTPTAPGPGDPPPVQRAPASPGDSAEAPQRPRYRYRGRFTKLGRLRFLGHLDLMRLLLRGLRRAGLPLVYSAGFNPKPRVGFGPALAVGISSESEYLDFETHTRMSPSDLLERINRVLPAGVRFDAVREIRTDAPALAEAVRAARYRVHTGDGLDLGRILARFKSRGPVRLKRTKKDGSVRCFELAEEVLGLEQLDAESLSMTLAFRSGAASVRPEEVLNEIFDELPDGLRMIRENLLVDWRGRLLDPLLAASAARSDAARTVH
jgi:radical SAM-linked protein